MAIFCLSDWVLICAGLGGRVCVWEGAEKTSPPQAAGKGQGGLGGQELEELNFLNSVVWIPASEPELFSFSPPHPPLTHAHFS